MATIGPMALTLADWAKRLDDDGKVAFIVNLLSQTNEILDDMLFVEGNIATGHKTTIRTGLPLAYWRLMNQGIPASKSTTAQITETCGHMEAFSDIDEMLAELGGNDKALRLSEDLAFIEGMNQQMAGINMDSVYLVVQRTIPGINGGNPVKYVERMDSRDFLATPSFDPTLGPEYNVVNAWFLDCALRATFTTPQTTVSGLDHLNGATVSALVDGSPVTGLQVLGGSVALPSAGSTVLVGLPYTSQLQTLCMTPEGMERAVQDYRKRISAVALRVAYTRGLKVGPNFSDLTEIKMRGQTAYMGTAVPLYTGDQRIVIDNNYVVEDDVCIEQDYPLPCTILGVIPEVAIGDSPG